MPAINYPLTYQLAELANQAYSVADYADPYFAAGVANLDGSKTAYASRQAWLTTMNFTPIVNPHGSTDMMKYWGVMTTVGGVLIIAFRGTNSIADLKIDLGNWDVGLGTTYVELAPWTVTHGGVPTQVLAHHRFLDTYQAVQAGVRQYVQTQLRSGSPPSAIQVTGHSLGGALANLCALDLAAFLGATAPTPQLMTFGCPFVGDQAFATLLNTLSPNSQRFELSWDPVTAHPNLGRPPGGPTDIPYVKAGTAMALTGPDWIQHFMTGYYWALKYGQPHGFNPGVDPTTVITDLTLKVKTADALGAGTDADISVNILGVNWGVLDLPWHNDFEQAAYDAYALFTLFPAKAPTGKRIQDLAALTLTMTNVGYFDVYDYSWKLAYVDVWVNGQEVIHIPFDCWIGPGEESGSAATRSIGF